jgi:uncharacterized membrane protein YgaE (UPF0421/DUF939 family)
MCFSIPITAFQLALRTAIAAGLAVAIAQLFRLEFPLYAMIAAVIVTDLSPSQTRQLGLQRLAGTVVGAVLGAALSPLRQLGPWAIGLGILVTISLCYLLRLQGAGKVAGYICGIVMLEHGVHPWSYALYRLIETVLGIGVAMLVSLVPKLIPPDAPKLQDP